MEGEEIAVKALVYIRLCLPAQKGPVELDWIELRSGSETRRFDF